MEFRKSPTDEYLEELVELVRRENSPVNKTEEQIEEGIVGQSFDEFMDESNLECGPSPTDTLALSNGFELCWWGDSLIIWSNAPGRPSFELNDVTRPDILKLIDYLENEYYNGEENVEE